MRAFEQCAATDDFGLLRVHFSVEQFQALQALNRQGQADDKGWERQLDDLVDGLFYELGLICRTPVIAADNSLASPWFRCEWNDLSLPPQRGLREHELLVNDTPDRLKLLGLQSEPAVNPANDNACAIIDKSARKTAEQAGLKTWDWSAYAILCLAAATRTSAGAFMNRPLYDLYTLRLRDFSPELVTILEEGFDPAFIVQVLRTLVADQINVRSRRSCNPSWSCVTSSRPISANLSCSHPTPAASSP